MPIDDPALDGLVHLRMSFDGLGHGQQAGRIIRDWFDLSWRELGGSIRDRVSAAPAATDRTPHGISLLGTTMTSDDEEVFFENEMSEWDAFLNRIATEPTEGASFRASASDNGGTPLPYYRTDDYWYVYLNRQQWQGRDLVQLTVESKDSYLYADPERTEAAAAFLERLARTTDVDYAEAGYGYGGLGTVIDSITYTPWWDSAGEAREKLRGYSWLTVVPASLVPRIGGSAELRDSDAFFAVDELPFGAVMLRATEQFADYGNEEAEKVFEVLRPVLRPDARASAFRHTSEARGM